MTWLTTTPQGNANAPSAGTSQVLPVLSANSHHISINLRISAKSVSLTSYIQWLKTNVSNALCKSRYQFKVNIVKDVPQINITIEYIEYANIAWGALPYQIRVFVNVEVWVFIGMVFNALNVNILNILIF